MKAYIPNKGWFRYPEDMEKILAYLEKYGTLYISTKEVERLYGEYCEKYWCAGWLEVTNHRLAGFAKWLSEVEI